MQAGLWRLLWHWQHKSVRPHGLLDVNVQDRLKLAELRKKCQHVKLLMEKMKSIEDDVPRGSRNVLLFDFPLDMTDLPLESSRGKIL